MTPTDRLSSSGTGLATNSVTLERVPRGHSEQYADLSILPIRLLSVAWLLGRNRAGAGRIGYPSCDMIRAVYVPMPTWIENGNPS